MRVFVQGIGLLAPGLAGWGNSAAVLTGATPYRPTAISFPPLTLLPPAERRRTPAVVKLAVSVGNEAITHAGISAAQIATVFTSSGGDGDVIHQICEALAQPEREMSPTRFHNSVHNAPAGYWGIATQSHEPSTSLCAYDASFAAGLIEAAGQATYDRRAVLLIAYDSPYPEPLHTARPIFASCGIGLLLSAQSDAASMAELTIELISTNGPRETSMPQAELEALRLGVPAARGLALLAAIADKVCGEVVIPYLHDLCLCISVQPNSRSNPP